MSLPRWSDLPDYGHVPYCAWGHIQKCCPSGCSGEPIDYPMTAEYDAHLSRWAK